MVAMGCRADRRLYARLHHGPLSQYVIELAATGLLGMAAAGQIRLAVVTGASTSGTASTGPGSRKARKTASLPMSVNGASVTHVHNDYLLLIVLDTVDNAPVANPDSQQVVTPR